MAEFLYAQPVKVRFGAGALNDLSGVLSELKCERCVLVCDPFFEKKAKELASKHPEIREIYSGIEPNPQLSGAEETARLAREYGAQAVIALGGGSAIDTAKFAAAVALGGAPAGDYLDGKPFPDERLKIIAVPTTAGTGSEVTQVSVMNRGEEKKTINHPAFMPAAAIVDPELMYSVPPRMTMITGLDALSHALEGFWSKNHQPVCDLYAIEAVRIIVGEKSLERAWRDGGDIQAREAMAYASLLAGMAFAQPKTAGCHACSYPLSMDYHLPHGEACAFTLDSFVKINADERLEELCRRAGVKDTDTLAAEIVALKKLAGLKCGLGELGDVDLDKLAADCAAHGLMRNNPVAMDAAALREMFQKLA